ncbi:response regulator [Chloroflexota bacterium]
MSEKGQSQSDLLMELLRTRAITETLDTPLAGPRQTGPLDAGLGAPWVVELRIQGAPFAARMEVTERIIIGRSDVSSNAYPDIDLTPYGGRDKGVSRQHAALLAGADRLLLVDLGSTNGTFVNEQRLAAQKPYRLRHGDAVRLGEINIEVLLDVVPVHEDVLQAQPWVRRNNVAQGGQGQRVLIVEGNPNISEALQTILTRLDYNVQVVQEMAEAFYAVTRRLPDVIVVNLDVSNINGLELCRYIQRLAHREYVPLIIISDKTDQAHVEEVMNAGVDVFLGKPIGVNQLVRAISSITQKATHEINSDITTDRDSSIS